jgi:hypothetical protein
MNKCIESTGGGLIFIMILSEGFIGIIYVYVFCSKGSSLILGSSTITMYYYVNELLFSLDTVQKKLYVVLTINLELAIVNKGVAGNLT